MERSKIQAPLGLQFLGDGSVDRINAVLHPADENRAYFHIPKKTGDELGISNGDRIYVVVYSSVGPFIMPKKVARYGNAIRVMITTIDREMGELNIGIRYKVLLVPWTVEK